MNRFLAYTAVGLVLGLSPALAQSSAPAGDAQTPPPIGAPSQIPEVMPDPEHPADPAAPIPGDSTQVSPSPMEPGDDAAPPPQSSEAPQPLAPDAPKSAEVSSDPQFLSKQASDDWLASSLIAQTVYNAENVAIGDINDLVTDKNGKIVAVLIGSGGFLGLGEKDVAVRFEDLKLARDENDSIKVVADVTKETLAAAPDYETLSEQAVTVGSTKDDREDLGGDKKN
jgi:PRC-barrel domain